MPRLGLEEAVVAIIKEAHMFYIKNPLRITM